MKPILIASLAGLSLAALLPSMGPAQSVPQSVEATETVSATEGAAVTSDVTTAVTTDVTTAVTTDVTTAATTAEATDTPPKLEDLLWRSRPIVIFADTPNDPRFQAQLAFLEAAKPELDERDVVVITDTNTDKDALSDLRVELRPRGFQLVLIGKDGQVKLRKPLPWTAREIMRVIDKMPMRQQEMQR